MGRMGIRYQDVVVAIQEVLDEHEQPTVERIRQKVGCGSNSTIARYLKEWKTQQNADFIPELPSELVAVIKALWQKLQQEAESKIHQIRENSDQEIRHYQQQCDEFQKERDNLKNHNEQYEKELHSAQQLIQSLEQKIVKQNIEIVKANEKYLSLVQQFDSLKQENVRLHELLLHMQTNLEHYQNAVEKQREEYIVFVDKQRMKFEEAIAALNHRLSHAMELEQQLQHQIEFLKNKDESQQKINHSLKKKREELQNQLLEKEIECITLKTRCEETEKVNQEKQAALHKTNDQVIDLEKKLVLALEHNAQLKKTNQDYQHSIQQLQNENAQRMTEKLKIVE